MKKYKFYFGKIVLLVIITLLTIVNVTAQDHESKDNYTGNWEDAGTWDIGGIPPEPVTMSTQVDIYGTTIKNSTLDVNKDFTLNVYDTLIIYGNFELNKDGNIFVHPGAFLIVYGDFTSAKDIEIDLESYLVIFGDFDLTNSATVTTPAGDTLLYATGTIDCAGGCSTTTVGDEDDMFDNPELDEIIEATSNFITPRAPTLCIDGSVVLSIRDDGNNYNWFETSDLGTTLSTEPTLTVSAVGTYDVDFYVGGVQQLVVPVTVTSSGATATHTISGMVTNETAIDAGDGEIDITVTGATDPIYDWSNGETTEDLSGLSAGDYMVEVEDVNGCRVTEIFSLGVGGCTDPSLSTVTAPEICNGSSYDLSNVVVVDANGTSPTYTYHSATPALPGNELVSATISPTTTTTYYILGTNGSCTDELAIDVTVNPLPVATIAFTAGNGVICDGEDTQLEVTVTGASPFDITVGNNRNAFTSFIAGTVSPWTFEPGTLDPGQEPVWIPADGATSTYTYTITTIIDDNGCIATNVDNIDVEVYKIPETGPQYHIPNDKEN